MSCAPTTPTLDGIKPFPWYKANPTLGPATWTLPSFEELYADAETTLPPLNPRFYHKQYRHRERKLDNPSIWVNETAVYEALVDGLMDFIDFNVRMLDNPVLNVIYRIVSALIYIVIALLRAISLTVHTSSTWIGFDSALYWNWIEYHLVVSRDRLRTGYLDRAYVIMSPLIYSYVFVFIRSVYYRTLGSLVSTVVENPRELEMSMSHDGIPTASGSVTYTPRWAHYPFPSISFQDWTVWKWCPIRIFSITRDVSFTVNAGQIASAVVQNLATKQPKQSGPATPEQELEMSVPLSTILPCKFPKNMGIVHCSPPGAVDLSRFPFALFGRVSIEGKTYGITASHVVRDLTLYTGIGRTIYVRTQHNGVSRDTPFPFPHFPVYKSSPVENLDVTIFEVPPGIWSQLGMKSAKTTHRVCKGDLTKVYTPFSNGKIGMAYGIVESAHSLFQFKHSASTEYGASGGLIVTKSNLVLGIHVRRHPRSKRNIGTALRPFFEPRTYETPIPQDDLWQEEEPDWGDDDHDVQFVDEEEYFLDDDEDEYQRYAIVRGKAGHRAMHATDRRTYTESEKTANFWRARNMDYMVDELETSSPKDIIDPTVSATTYLKHQHEPRDDTPVVHKDSKTPGSAAPKPESIDPEIKASFKPDQLKSEGKPADPKTKVPLADFPIGASTPSTTVSVPKIPLPILSDPPAPTPSNPNLEVTSGKKAKQQTVTSSSAQPSVASPRVGGPKKRRRRPRKKKKSKASTSGTPPTPQSPQPGVHSPTKQPKGLLESAQADKVSKKHPTASSQNTPKPLSPQDLENLKTLMNKFSAAASSGTSKELFPKTQNPESPTQ
jgi:hypothetical protein